MLTKEAIREELLLKRKGLSLREKSTKDRKISLGLMSLPEFERAGVILLYHAIAGEPDLTPVFMRILREGRRLVLPKVSGRDLELIAVEDLSSLSRGAFGILQPQEGERVSPMDLDVAVVPGIAFDRECYRLGFGKGYYDRLLKEVRAPKVGVAYSFQVLDRVPRDEWDEPVSILITEEEVIRR